MSRASPALSEAYSEATSQYSYRSEASSSSAGSFQPKGRTASGATSIVTRSTAASATTDGLSYSTVETTKTEKQNRTWLDHFWAWMLTEEKDHSKNIDNRPSPIISRSHSSFSDESSVGSARSDASELSTYERQQFVVLEKRNAEQQVHQKNVVVGFDSIYERDSTGDGLQSDDNAVKRSRHRARPPTPRYTEHRSPTPEHSPSPLPIIDARSGPPGDTDSFQDDEGSEETKSTRSSRIGIRSKRDLPPRPTSQSTFGKGRGPLSLGKAGVATSRMSKNERPPSPSPPDAPKISIKSSGNNGQVPGASLGDKPSGVSVKEIIQKIQNPPSSIIKDKQLKVYKSSEPSSATKGKVENPQKNASGRSANLFSKSSRVKDTRESHGASSRFRSLGARKRFDTPVFLRSASFDGVLTDDSFTTSASRDDSKSSTLVPLTGQEKADGTRKTREDKDKCFTESRCDDAVERNLSPEELDQNNQSEESSPTKTRIFGDRTMKTTRNFKEQNWSQFSGSAAVFLSLFQQKDDNSGEKPLTTTSYQPVIPRHTMSMDRYDGSSVHSKDSETSETETETSGNVKTFVQPKTIVSNQGRASAQKKVLWTQLKAHRSFS